MEKKMRIKRFLSAICLGGMLFIIGCENPITGYGPQPSFIEKEEYVSKLNVLGILRPGLKERYPLSFVHLEHSVPATEEYPEAITITDGWVTVSHCKGNTVFDIVRFYYTDFNGIFTEREYRYEGFYPEPGATYKISCKKEGFPELTGETTVPNVPVIVNNSLSTSASVLSLTLARDPLAALYDVYLFAGEKEFFTRVFRPEEGDIDVSLQFVKGTENEGTVIIYAYDLNLSKYMTTTVIIKPNTYQPLYTTVTGGYGCFGSMNVLEQKVKF